MFFCNFPASGAQYVHELEANATYDSCNGCPRLRFGEVLSHAPLPVVTKGVPGGVSEYDGSVYQGNLFWANQVDTFVSGDASKPQT